MSKDEFVPQGRRHDRRRENLKDDEKIDRMLHRRDGKVVEDTSSESFERLVCAKYGVPYKQHMR